MKPTIIIEDDVYKKIMHWVNKSQFEVSGLGMVRVEKDGILRVVSAMLLPQKNAATHTDIEAEDVNKALYDLRDSDGELKFWWHSHVMMGVFWSGTDHDTIKKIGEGGWMVATVFNQKNELKSCYYGANGQSTPWGTAPLFLDDLKTEVTTLPDSRTSEWDAEYAKNVTIKTYAARDFSSQSYGHYDREAGRWITAEEERMGEIVGIKSGNTSTEYDVTVCPPLDRPVGMTKRQHKAWNSAHVKWKAAQLQPSLGTVVKPPSEPLIDESGVDEYGFDGEERQVFAAEGWSLNDIDELVDEDFSPSELVRLARAEVSVAEIQKLLRAEYTSEEVMDCLEHGLMGHQDILTARAGLYE